jgi:hypothetical protein
MQKVTTTQIWLPSATKFQANFITCGGESSRILPPIHSRLYGTTWVGLRRKSSETLVRTRLPGTGHKHWQRIAYRFSSPEGFSLYIDFAALPHELEKSSIGVRTIIIIIL